MEKNKMLPIKILVQVNGGCVTSIISNNTCDVILIDWDEISDGNIENYKEIDISNFGEEVSNDKFNSILETLMKEWNRKANLI